MKTNYCYAIQPNGNVNLFICLKNPECIVYVSKFNNYMAFLLVARDLAEAGCRIFDSFGINSLGKTLKSGEEIIFEKHLVELTIEKIDLNLKNAKLLNII